MPMFRSSQVPASGLVAHAMGTGVTERLSHRSRQVDILPYAHGDWTRKVLKTRFLSLSCPGTPTGSRWSVRIRPLLYRGRRSPAPAPKALARVSGRRPHLDAPRTLRSHSLAIFRSRKSSNTTWDFIFGEYRIAIVSSSLKSMLRPLKRTNLHNMLVSSFWVNYPV